MHFQVGSEIFIVHLRCLVFIDIHDNSITGNPQEDFLLILCKAEFGCGRCCRGIPGHSDGPVTDTLGMIAIPGIARVHIVYWKKGN